MNNILQFSISLLISLIGFTFIFPKVFPYAAILLVLTILVLFWWKHNRNVVSLVSYFSTLVGNIIGYCLHGFIIDFYNLETQIILILIAGAITLIVFVNKYQHSGKDTYNSGSEINKEIIFSEHAFDLERLTKLIAINDIVGVNSPWGEGKTFIVDEFCKAQKEQGYQVLKFETIAYSYQDFDKILLQKLSQLLKEKFVISPYIYDLQTILGENFFGTLFGRLILKTTDRNSSIFEGIREDLQKLDTHVILVFEDIERIDHPEVIKKLFAIIEKLASNNIKIILEYDGSKLDSVNINWDYREKYIQAEINVTRTSYYDLLHRFWYELNMDKSGYKIDDFRTLPYPATNIFGDRVCNILDVKNPATYSARRMKKFLIESKFFLNEFHDFRREGKSGLLRVLYLKNFLHAAYECFVPEKRLEDTLFFKTDKGKVSLKELVKQIVTDSHPREYCSVILSNEKNALHYFVFSYLGYSTYDYQQMAKYDGKQGKRLSIDKKHQFLLNSSRRDIMDHIIWNVLASGESEYTDRRSFVNRFKKDVLAQTDSEKLTDAWNQLFDDCFRSNIYKRSESIFRFGFNPMVEIAEALFYCAVSESTWIDYLRFYEIVNRPVMLNLNLVRVYSYIPLTHQQTLIASLNLFNKAEIVGNLNDKIEYSEVLAKYISFIEYWGFVATNAFNIFNYWYENHNSKTINADKENIVNANIKVSHLGLKRS